MGLTFRLVQPVDITDYIKIAGQILLNSCQRKSWALLPTPERPTDQEFKLSGVALSRSGQELMQIIDIEPIDEYTEALRVFLDSSKLQMVDITPKA